MLFRKIPKEIAAAAAALEREKLVRGLEARFDQIDAAADKGRQLLLVSDLKKDVDAGLRNGDDFANREFIRPALPLQLLLGACTCVVGVLGALALHVVAPLVTVALIATLPGLAAGGAVGMAQGMRNERVVRREPFFARMKNLLARCDERNDALLERYPEQVIASAALPKILTDVPGARSSLSGAFSAGAKGGDSYVHDGTAPAPSQQKPADKPKP